MALPLLTEDHDGDVGEHEGVDHEHDQDRTCHRGNRNSIFNILIITQEPDKLVQFSKKTSATENGQIVKYLG